MADGYSERRADRINELIFLAWHTEAFARIKRLPDLQSLLNKNTRPHEPQTDEEMMAKARMLNMLYGGGEVEVN